MAHLCSMSDIYILNKIHSGEWVPSLDTGQVYSKIKKGFLTTRATPNGYTMAEKFQVSHIIWVAANGPVPHGMNIDHINGDRTDNRLCNLRLLSASENTSLGIARLTYAQAEEIRRRYAEGGISQRKLAKEYGISKFVVSELLKNRTYKKPVNTSSVSEETRQRILEAYKNGRSIDTIRSGLKMQQAIVRQVLEEELNREAEERKKQENKS